MIKIRIEKEADYIVIDEINSSAFNGEGESKLIRAIRDSEWFVPELSLIAEKDEEVVGHILFSEVTIQTENEQVPTLALAPMAVSPQHQKQGIGTLLVQTGLEKAQQLGYEHVVVLGHPDFYPKFGFVSSVAKGIHSPFPVPEEVFMVLELKKGSLEGIKGKVEYPPAFSAVT
ncbi:N-acetyltransferase [Fictibacillus sp. b24]|uniref:GNAT family N-acetyltransferase n=1 Tax=Fictibacillus sp. b24 TaxID=3055863 RepID=UPI0025A3110A|nr:N-acetyltransferase [Fictibacillus sp. b24]MDM5317453.1 N-acetyltransferase [Fictibacillus sp. b24]